MTLTFLRYFEIAPLGLIGRLGWVKRWSGGLLNIPIRAWMFVSFWDASGPGFVLVFGRG